MKNLLLISLFLLKISYAVGQSSAEQLNVFTGTDYVSFVIELNDHSGKVEIEAEIGKNDTLLWKGDREARIFKKNGHSYVHFLVKDISPELWTPATPFLYDVQLRVKQKNQLLTEKAERIGFRSFESRNGQIYLNGKPIFLRGIAINPPGRGIPGEIEQSRQFAYDYVRFMKSIHVNIIRIPDYETWYDVCDELGMMVFGGNYSGSVNGEKPPEDYDSAIAWYETEKYNKISNHPALMIYAITNETPFHGSKAKPWEDFTKFAHKKLTADWDSTRLYIGNAGYGYGKSGDICDLHRYWGWYYSSPYTFLNIRDNSKIIPFKKPVQPITFTECVGNYTGPDGRYNLSPDHKNPVSQLAWTGHAPQNIQARLASEHQVYTFKQATELFRRLRSVNPELAGIFPFTIMFHNWHTIENFTDMEPKDVAFQAKISYAPVLLSWEIWTPNVYAGSTFTARLHIVNDSDTFEDVTGATFSYEVVDGSGKSFCSASKELPDIRYYDTYAEAIQVDLPKDMPTGSYKIKGYIRSGEKVISSNSYDLFVASAHYNSRSDGTGEIVVYDPEGTTTKGLDALGIHYSAEKNLSELPNSPLLVIGKDALKQPLDIENIHTYVDNGGRVLVLRQGKDQFAMLDNLLPARLQQVDMDIDNATYPPPERPSRNGFNVNPERPDHPVFNGLERENFKIWSDYTDWNEQQPGMPRIYPVMDGLSLKDSLGMDNVAILADYSIGLEGLALIEIFQKKGSYMASGFDLVNRIGKDPVADKLLINMIDYMSRDVGHFASPLINSPIQWGQYGTEKGVLTGIKSGFKLNSKPLLTGSYKDIPLVVTKEGHLLAGRRGGWNTRPGLQYVPYGRRAFGPYFHRGFGGVPEAYDYSDNGKAEFWCRVEDHIQLMNTLVWNPTPETLMVKCVVNGKEIMKEVGPEMEVWVQNKFKPEGNNHVVYQADRRMVFLETVFE